MTANNLGTLFSTTACLSSSALHAVKEHAAKSSLGFKFAYHTQAITPTKTGCLLPGLLNQFQQLLAHTDRKCVLRSEDRDKRSIWIRTMHITEQNLSESQQCKFHVTINFLFKVLFIFPSRYFFAIGLVPIFSFRRSLLPILGCIPNQPNA